jgi:hypothetical protein
MEERAVEIKETIPASRKLGEETARQLIASASKVTIAKGKKLEAFDGGTATNDMVSKMLGSTGNLRAPTIVVGDRLVVGFNHGVYDEVFGS